MTIIPEVGVTCVTALLTVGHHTGSGARPGRVDPRSAVYHPKRSIPCCAERHGRHAMRGRFDRVLGQVTPEQEAP
jgi:hypothetical protein